MRVRSPPHCGSSSSEITAAIGGIPTPAARPAAPRAPSINSSRSIARTRQGAA
jgi:hypothetical protein